LGLTDEEVEAGLKRAVDQGFKHFKLKVGQGLETDRKRLGMVRKVAGDQAVIMTDVNQLWDVGVSTKLWLVIIFASDLVSVVRNRIHAEISGPEPMVHRRTHITR